MTTVDEAAWIRSEAALLLHSTDEVSRSLAQHSTMLFKKTRRQTNPELPIMQYNNQSAQWMRLCKMGHYDDSVGAH